MTAVLTPQEAAKRLVAEIEKAEKSKLRISEVALRSLTRLEKLHFNYLTQLQQELSQLNWMFEPLLRGGFGLVDALSLENAPFFKLSTEEN